MRERGHGFFGVLRRHADDGSEERISQLLEAVPGRFKKGVTAHSSDHLVVCCGAWREYSTPGGASLVTGFSGYTFGQDDSFLSLDGADPSGRILRFAKRSASGEAFREFSDVDGPFLAVVADPLSSVGYLIRDRFGLRQLFYRTEPGRVWFADDVRWLLELSGAPRVRPYALLEWLHYGNPLQPRTLFEDVSMVEQGHVLVYRWQEDSVRQEKYFDPSDAVSALAAEELEGQSGRALETKFIDLFDRAIESSAKDEAVVTVLTSGGVDSSYVAATAARFTRVHPVVVDVRGPDAESEIAHAQKLADHLGVELAACPFGRDEFRSHLCDTVHDTCQPVINENSVALLHAANAGYLPAEQLILDGGAADALFGGTTPLFKLSLFSLMISRLTRLPVSRIRRRTEWLRGKLRRVGLETRSSLDGWGLDTSLAALRTEQQRRLAELLETYKHVTCSARREISALTLMEFYDYALPLFIRLDRMSALVRSHLLLPYLETEVFRFGVNLPVDQKIRFRRWGLSALPKALLKRVAARRCPPEIIYRPKVGFEIPGARWVGAFPRVWLEDSWVAEHFSLPGGTLSTWLELNRGSRDLMFLITMEIWGRLFARREPLETVREQYLEEVGAPNSEFRVRPSPVVG